MRLDLSKDNKISVSQRNDTKKLLTNCKSCGQELSKNADSCPKCGDTTIKKERDIKDGCLGCFVGIIIIGILTLTCNNCSQTPKTPERPTISADARISVQGFNITITNLNDFTWIGPIKFNINGIVFGAYEYHTIKDIGSHESISLSLLDFTNGNSRFNPLTTKVSEVYIFTSCEKGDVVGSYTMINQD